MATPRMRPTFEIDVPDARSILEALEQQLASDGAPCRGQVFRHHAVLYMPERARNLWSPWLNLEVRPDGDHAVVHARFSPHPNVWTGFMAIYGILTMLALAGAVLGLSQLVVDTPAWGLFIAPASLLMGGFVYGAAFIGQGLSGEQMYELRSFLDRAVEETRRAES